jgi:hypothetical protein
MEREYLEEIINLFISKKRRERFRDLLSTKHRYDDFLEDLLGDPRYLEPTCIIELPGNQQFAEVIYQKLIDLGAGPRCYIASTDSDLDGRILDLGPAISEIAETMSESLIYSLGTKLAYYEGHEGWRYILRA